MKIRLMFLKIGCASFHTLYVPFDTACICLFNGMILTWFITRVLGFILIWCVPQTFLQKQFLLLKAMPAI